MRMASSSNCSLIHCIALLVFAGLTASESGAQVEDPNSLPVLVVRGGHYYETPAFEEMCLSWEDTRCDLVLTAHFQAMKAEDIAEKYSAILFLNQNKKYRLEDRHRQRYMNLAELGVGMVFLHFTLSSQPEWDEYHNLIGGKWFLKKFEPDPRKHSTYFPQMVVDLKVLQPEHPVMKGLTDFQMEDAFYGNIHIAPGVTPLLGAHDPTISRVIAWTHKYQNSKVVYVMPGYSNGAFGNPSYRKLLRNALFHVSGQIR